MMRGNLVTCVVGISMLLSASADETWPSSRGLYAVTYTSELQPIEINRLHAWTLHIETAGGEAVLGAAIEVSGGMPVHDHGLPTRPRVTREIGNGDYRLEGLRFHMAGDWIIEVTITVDDVSDVATVALRL